MNQRIGQWLMGMILLWLVGCVPATSSEPAAIVTAVSIPTIPATVTAVLTEQPAPPRPGEPTPLPYPPPPPTITYPSYPGPPPESNHTQSHLTPTPTIAIIAIDECVSHSSFSRCGGTSLTGKLAYLDTNGRLTVLNLNTEIAWQSSQTGLKDVDWSPNGRLLLVHDENLHSFLYLPEGALFDYRDQPARWQMTGDALRNDSLIWSADESAAASIIFVEVEVIEGGSSVAERQVQIDFHGDDAGQKYWSLEDPDFRYDSIALLDWVPGTEWLLFGRANGGVATQMATGWRLLALNARSGDILDSGLYIPIDADFDWHPTIPGLLVTPDLSGADVGGWGALATWHILENQVASPLTNDESIFSPAWSPNGRYIAYSARDLSANMWLKVLDTETGQVETWAEQGAWPAWDRDGSTLFYAEMNADSDSVRILAKKGAAAEAIMVAEAQFPSCPGSCQPRTVFDYASTETPFPGQAIPPFPTNKIIEEATETLIHAYPSPDPIWHTYREDSFGFTFTYPSNWVVNISPKIEHHTGAETPITIKNYNDNIPTKSHTWRNETVKIEYIIYPKPPEFSSLEEWCTNYPYLTPETEYSEIQPVKINETEGIRWLAKGPTTPQGVILFAFVKGEQIHQFTYRPATSSHATIAEQIIASFQISE